MIKETGTGEKASRNERTSPLQREWIQGETITRGSITVIPIAHRISLGLPGWMRQDEGLAVICQRPAALIVKRGDSTQTIRIHDVTRIIIFTMMAVTALCLYLLMRPNRRT